MKLNPDNDVYTGDLSILNIRKQAWAKGEPRGDIYRRITYVLLVITLIVLLLVGRQTFGGSTMMSQLPVHITIWTAALIILLVSRQGKKISEIPFNGYHSARFETDDDTIYYVYQQGMTLKTYFIKDKDIKCMTRDDESGVLLIEGDAVINTQRRNGEDQEKVSEFYALVPFDKYDLDDLLAPYKKKVKSAPGKLRDKYRDEH